MEKSKLNEIFGEIEYHTKRIGGPDHSPVFESYVALGEEQYNAIGSTKKEAECKVAIKILNKLNLLQHDEKKQTRCPPIATKINMQKLYSQSVELPPINMNKINPTGTSYVFPCDNSGFPSRGAKQPFGLYSGLTGRTFTTFGKTKCETKEETCKVQPTKEETYKEQLCKDEMNKEETCKVQTCKEQPTKEQSTKEQSTKNNTIVDNRGNESEKITVIYVDLDNSPQILEKVKKYMISNNGTKPPNVRIVGFTSYTSGIVKIAKKYEDIGIEIQVSNSAVKDATDVLMTYYVSSEISSDFSYFKNARVFLLSRDSFASALATTIKDLHGVNAEHITSCDLLW